MKGFIVVGFVLLGYVIPEWLFMFSPNYEKIKRIPIMQNIVSSIMFGCIAMGVF